MLGPRNVLRGRPNPVSSNRRRDFGIWGAVVGLTHLGIGLTVHFRGRMQLYFIAPPESGGVVPIRLDAFGAANYLGAIAGGVLLVLLLLSNDRALGRLGTRRWKAWRRLNYLGALAVLGHGGLYQTIERRHVELVILFGGVAARTLVVQGLGLGLGEARRRLDR